jgi:nitrite reductase/ring-hydroxylating ferredoxin subunit
LSLLQRRIRTGWEAMISPIRSLHRRTFVALAIVLPVILSIGIGARSRPGSNSGGSSLPATWYVVKQSSSLWQKNTILSTFYSTPSRPQDIHVVLVPSHELNEPDLLLYWANDPPSGNALPTEAQFIGVALGALQSETSPMLAASLVIGVATVLSLHLAAAFREKRLDREKDQASAEGFVEVCKVDRIAENCATIVALSGERVAVFRYDGKVSAISNVCQHQNGPLGEGRIIDGCVTCPWHGYQYRPESGAAPAPFKEKVPTFRVKVVQGTVFVHPSPNPPGTLVQPAQIESDWVARLEVSS